LKALEIKKKHYGEDNVEYAITLQNLCGTLNNLGEYEKAKEGYLKALNIKKKHYGDDHIEYARTLENLCITLMSLGEYEKSK
jgi:tetratricopeptide (TPR) repeat protein